MQRKNNLLRPQKKGFAMIAALAVIVIIATTLALSLKLSTQTTKNTVDLYIKEQANLLVRSAGEYAKLRIALDNNTTTCYNGETLLENNMYIINLNVTYAFSADSALEFPTCTLFTSSSLQQNLEYGAAKIDITVEVNDPTITTEPIRIFKRKLIEL